MFGDYFYNAAIQKYVSAFGYLFSDIHVQRVDEANTKIQEIRVPIIYAPKQHFLSKLKVQAKEDSDGDMLADSTKRPLSVLLPRMAYEIKGMVPDPSRRLPRTTRYCVPSTAFPGAKTTVYAPTPWNIMFSLYVVVKNAEDANKIVEQILPYFNPEWTVGMTLVPGMSMNFDIPIVLNDVTITDTYEGPIENNRMIVWTLDFTVKAQFFGPTSNSKPIKVIFDEFMVPVGDINDSTIGSTDPIAVITIRPGLTANGEPTTDANNSVGIDSIESTDNYGIIETYVESTSNT